MCNLYNGGVQHACTWCAKRNLYILWCSVQCGRLDTLTNRFGPSWWYLPPPPHCLSCLIFIIASYHKSLMLYAPYLFSPHYYLICPLLLLNCLPYLSCLILVSASSLSLPLMLYAPYLLCTSQHVLPPLIPSLPLLDSASLLPLLTSASLCCQPSLFLPCLSPF